MPNLSYYHPVLKIVGCDFFGQDRIVLLSIDQRIEYDLVEIFSRQLVQDKLGAAEKINPGVIC